MATQSRRSARPRGPLTRERVLEAATRVADEGGVSSLTMRRIAQKLGVEAMSLYHHVANKDDILNGIVDDVFGEIELPGDGTQWKKAMRKRAHSARAAIARHPWAIGLMESRKDPGAATLRHHNAVLGSLRAGGFSIAMAGHAFSVLDSYIYGFAVQELNMPIGTAEELEEVGEAMLQQVPSDTYPHLIEMVQHVLKSGYAYADEFAFGLELILDGLEGLRDATE